MHFRNNHAAAVAIAAAVLLLSGKVSVSAQDTSGITRLTPAAMEPVKSGVSLPEGALDTLDTADPRIKVLLLSDYTWKFIKDPTYARDEGIFTEDWNTELAVPYRMPAITALTRPRSAPSSATATGDATRAATFRSPPGHLSILPLTARCALPSITPAMETW